ncbi:MAG: S-methyl-5-thioribose-1-phosphate isomerase [Bacteroidales bacterium]|nr:S-methyl-5-thioribose-1-phosphate isomerase [Bacteroidales bacterium]
MKINGKNYRSIWIDDNKPDAVNIIDQTKLPFSFEIKVLKSVEDVYEAISDMSVRGAPAIGAAGAWGMYLSTLEITRHTQISDHLHNAAGYLSSCRPTAVNLSWAVARMLNALSGLESKEKLIATAFKTASEITENIIDNCKNIGNHGLEILRQISISKNGAPVYILTHCNAGWLACVDYGTATAPIYFARDEGIQVHVWVDETRPRNQGARLTCFELEHESVPHTLITDNAGGYLMQKKMVDLVITGSDRVTGRGDTANKTGTYLKALAAKDNNVPFYVALPSSSFDLNISDGLKEIQIEERDPEEVTVMEGFADGKISKFRICGNNTVALNHAFDITPARLITAFITEKGIVKPDEKSILKMFKLNHK